MQIAVLGCGSIGRRHLRNLRALGYADLLAFDPSAAARDQAQVESGAVGCAALEDVWAQKPEVVLVTAPSNQHIALALTAARYNCHLFIEKPLSHSLADVETLCSEVDERNLISMVGCNMRFHPGPAKVKALLDQGQIGRVIAARIYTGSYLPTWRPGVDYRQSYSASAVQGGGAILDCIHEIDLALWYFGPAVVQYAVKLPAESIGLEVEGLLEVLLRHDSGVLSSVHLNFIQRDYHRGCEIIGSEGSLYWRFSEGKIYCYAATGSPTLIEQPSDWTVNQMYVDELRYFMEHIESGTPTFSNLQHGLAALQIALTAKTYPILVSA